MSETNEAKDLAAGELLDLVPDGILVVDRAGRIEAANARIEELFGFAPAELVGREVEVLIPEELRERHRPMRDAFLADPQLRPMGSVQREITGQHRDGRCFPLDIMLGPLPENGGHVMAVLRDVSHLHEVEQQLRAALAELGRTNAELAELNEKKNRVLGIAAHDLRNPLAAIAGYAKLLSGGAIGAVSKPQSELLGNITASVDTMCAMLEELLDISAIEAGSLVLRKQDVDVVRLVRDTLRVQRMVAEQKGITIELDAPSDLEALQLDPGKIEQVLHNLVSNAVKYSEPATRIEVRVRRGAGEVAIEVCDRGQGIPAKDLPHIFEPFRKSSAAPTAGESSTGLGLAIALRIAEAHRGQLRVSSEVGRGSTFTLTLPLRPRD